MIETQLLKCRRRFSTIFVQNNWYTVEIYRSSGKTINIAIGECKSTYRFSTQEIKTIFYTLEEMRDEKIKSILNE